MDKSPAKRTACCNAQFLRVPSLCVLQGLEEGRHEELCNKQGTLNVSSDGSSCGFCCGVFCDFFCRLCRLFFCRPCHHVCGFFCRPCHHVCGFFCRPCRLFFCRLCHHVCGFFCRPCRLFFSPLFFCRPSHPFFCRLFSPHPCSQEQLEQQAHHSQTQQAQQAQQAQLAWQGQKTDPNPHHTSYSDDSAHCSTTPQTTSHHPPYCLYAC